MSQALENLDERTLRELTDKGGPLAARWCAVCDHHYRFCRCRAPVWQIRNEGLLGPMPGEAGGPVTLAEYFPQ